MLDFLTDQLLFPAAVLFLLAGCAFAVVVGIGLMVRGGGALRYFASLNRWVSTRAMMKSAERSHDVDSLLHRQRSAWGVAIVVVAGLSLFTLLRGYDVAVLVAASRNLVAPVIAELAAVSALWILVAGHVLGIALGIALVFFPGALAALENRGNRSFSLRSQTRELERMHLSVDRWVESHPRAAGLVVVVLAVFVIVSLGGTYFSRS